MPFLFQVKQHLERKTERWRETKKRERRLIFVQTSNSAATSEARSQTFPVEVSFCAGLQICSCDQIDSRLLDCLNAILQHQDLAVLLCFWIP